MTTCRDNKCCVIVRDVTGNEIRRKWSNCIHDMITLNNIYPSLAELIDGFSSEQHFDNQIDIDQLNPKVHALVKALFLADIQTTLSGDLCGNDLVYVDLAIKYLNILKHVILPNGWIIVQQSALAAREALGLPDNKHCYYNLMDSYPKIRLTRKGETVYNKEAQLVVKALTHLSDLK